MLWGCGQRKALSIKSTTCPSIEMMSMNRTIQARSHLVCGRILYRLRAERPNHVWSYDFVEDRAHEGRKYRMLNLIDGFTHECLAIRVDGSSSPPT